MLNKHIVIIGIVLLIIIGLGISLTILLSRSTPDEEILYEVTVYMRMNSNVAEHRRHLHLREIEFIDDKDNLVKPYDCESSAPLANGMTCGVVYDGDFATQMHTRTNAAGNLPIDNPHFMTFRLNSKRKLKKVIVYSRGINGRYEILGELEVKKQGEVEHYFGIGKFTSSYISDKFVTNSNFHNAFEYDL